MKALAFALGCAALALTLALPRPARAVQAPPALSGIGVDEHVGAQVPLDAGFVNTLGQPVRLGAVLGNGKPTILVLAYSHCSMLCSLVQRGVAGAVPRLKLEPGKDFSLVTVSIDPHEQPGEASRVQQSLLVQAGYAGQSARWPFLLGKKAAIDAVARAVGFRYRWDERTHQFAHPAVIFVLSPQGKVAAYFYGLRPDPTALAQALAGHPPQSRAKSLAASVLSCFHFDTLARRYGGRIRHLFQLGAALVFGALLLGVGLLFYRNRTAQ